MKKVIAISIALILALSLTLTVAASGEDSGEQDTTKAGLPVIVVDDDTSREALLTDATDENTDGTTAPASEDKGCDSDILGTITGLLGGIDLGSFDLSSITDLFGGLDLGSMFSSLGGDFDIGSIIDTVSGLIGGGSGDSGSGNEPAPTEAPTEPTTINNDVTNVNTGNLF